MYQTLSLASAVSGALTSAIGSYWQTKAQKSAMEYQARMSEINARIAEGGAQHELRIGNEQIAQLTLQHAQLKGRQRAAMAANGVDLGEGSAAEVQISSEMIKDMDMATLKYNAVRRAISARGDAVNSSNAALAARATGSQYTPLLSASTSLIGSAGAVAKTYYLATKGTSQD